MQQHRDVLCHIISFISDHTTLKNISYTHSVLNSCVRQSVKQIGSRSPPVSFRLARYLEKLEVGHFRVRDAKDFHYVLAQRSKLKNVNVYSTGYSDSSDFLADCVHCYGKCSQLNPQIATININLFWNHEKINLYAHTITINTRHVYEQNDSQKYIRLNDILKIYVPIKIVNLPRCCDASLVTYCTTQLPQLEEINGYGAYHHVEIMFELIDRVKAVRDTSIIIFTNQLKPSFTLQKLNFLIQEDQLDSVLKLYPNLTEITLWRPEARSPPILKQYPQLKTVHINQYGLKLSDPFKGAATRVPIGQTCENLTLTRA